MRPAAWNSARPLPVATSDIMLVLDQLGAASSPGRLLAMMSRISSWIHVRYPANAACWLGSRCTARPYSASRIVNWLVARQHRPPLAMTSSFREGVLGAEQAGGQLPERIRIAVLDHFEAQGLLQTKLP